MISQTSTAAKLQMASKKRFDLRDSSLFSKTCRAIDMVFKFTRTREDRPDYEIAWLEDNRWADSSLNPHYGQTSGGLFLEFCGDLPSRIWTLWGRWEFGGRGGGPWNEVNESLLMCFGAVLYREIETDYLGERGPVYALYRVRNMPLPEPVEEMRRDAYTTFEGAINAWEEMADQYQTNLHAGKAKRA